MGMRPQPQILIVSISGSAPFAGVPVGPDPAVGCRFQPSKETPDGETEEAEESRKEGGKEASPEEDRRANPLRLPLVDAISGLPRCFRRDRVLREGVRCEGKTAFSRT